MDDGTEFCSSGFQKPIQKQETVLLYDLLMYYSFCHFELIFPLRNSTNKSSNAKIEKKNPQQYSHHLFPLLSSQRCVVKHSLGVFRQQLHKGAAKMNEDIYSPFSMNLPSTVATEINLSDNDLKLVKAHNQLQRPKSALST